MKMKWQTITLMVILMSNLASATNYYYNSSSGNDANDCTTPALACRTLADLQSWVVPENSTVYFNGCEQPYRGFYGRDKYNTTYTSYGGCRAKIWGSVNASATAYWTDIGGNKYESLANFSAGPVYQIFYNTSPMIDSGVQLGQRYASDSSLSADWDFYWNDTSNKILLYNSAGNPGTVGNGIEIPAYNRSAYNGPMMNFNSFDKLTFDNLEFAFGRYMGIFSYYITNLTINNVSFKFIYEKATFIEHGEKNTIANSSYYKCGIRGDEAPKGLDAQGENLFTNAEKNLLFINNVVERCGGVCINPFHSSGVQVINNKVFNSEQSATDWSAGIYFDGCNMSSASYNNISDTNVGMQAGSEIAGWGSNYINFTYNIVANSMITDMQTDVTNLANKNNTYIFIDHNTFYKSKHTGGSGFGNQIMLQEYINLTFTNNIIFNNYTNTTGGYLISVHNGTSGTMGLNFSSNYNSWNSTNRQIFNYDVSQAKYRINGNVEKQ
jgi:hypothetical protein